MPLWLSQRVNTRLPDCNSDAQNEIVNRARQLLSSYEDMAELIRLGAYRKGSDPLVDEAIYYYQPIEAFIAQGKNEHTDLEQGYAQLAAALDREYPPPANGEDVVEGSGEARNAGNA